MFTGEDYETIGEKTQRKPWFKYQYTKEERLQKSKVGTWMG